MVKYDMNFVSEMNHMYKHDKKRLFRFMENALENGSDFQKAYTSGLRLYLINNKEITPSLIHGNDFTLSNVCKPPMVECGYAPDYKPIEEFRTFNVWVSEVG